MDSAMTPVAIFKRADGCPSGYIRSGDWCYSVWHMIVRWVVLGVCLLLLFAILACFFIRRRRSRHAKPNLWTGQPQQQQGYNANDYNNQQQYPPPQQGYTPQPNSHDYYAGDQMNMPSYGQQQQPPPQYVQNPAQTYQPPAGPPPNK